MKKLSTEEKAKRYDKLIELVNSKWHYKNQPCFINVSELFPEFKENKDENIRKWLIEYFKEYKSTGIEGFANGLKIDTIIDWLEKQSESNPYSGVSFKYNGHIWGMCARDNGVEVLLDGKIKQRVFLNKIQAVREMANNAKKVEPKFKVGDWIIDKQGFVHQIKNVIANVTNDTFGYDIVGGGYFNDNSDVRLWTIEDAKDGDVLCVNNEVFIYAHKKQMYSIAIAHCFVDSAGGFYLGGEFVYREYGKTICPATKEQRDLLFQKMKEAGYKWDVNKKIPIKVTTISKTQTSQYCYILNYNTGEAFKHHITEDEVNLTTEELLKKYGFKETECHIMYSSNNLELKLLEN